MAKLKVRKTVLSLLIWLGAQMVTIGPLSIFNTFKGRDPMADMDIAMALSLVLELAVFMILGYFRPLELKDNARPRHLAIILPMGICVLYAVELLSIPFDLDDNAAGIIKSMTGSVWGFLAICILGPLGEEIMFRRIALSEIAQSTGKVWIGILVQAALFSLIHGNPIQMFFALPSGILFGWLYVRTGSFLVPVSLHILNNTLSFITIRMGATDQPEFADPVTLASLAGCLLVTAALVVWIQRRYPKMQ